MSDAQDRPGKLAGLLRAVSVRGGARSFVHALARPSTYLPHRNSFVVFGFLWGLPVPLVTIGIRLSATGKAWSLEAVGRLLATDPIHIWFLVHPILFAVVFGALGTLADERRRQIDELVHELQHLAQTDGLTGLLNHITFYERAAVEVERAEREQLPLALLMGDLDHFKRFNDEHGHPAGDHLLAAVARRIEETVRPYDIVCRYGGEEFAILMPGVDETEGGVVGERVRQAVEAGGYELPGVAAPTATLSVGVASYRYGESVSSWVERADARLYRAKQEGRNRVCCASRPRPVAWSLALD